MYNIEHKNSMYSLKQCKQFIYNMASNIDYSENEGLLTSVFHYLEEYESKLRKEYISRLQPLFKVQYISDCMFFDGTSKDGIYEVVEELENQYVIKNDLGDISTLQKEKFIKVK